MYKFAKKLSTIYDGEKSKVLSYTRSYPRYPQKNRKKTGLHIIMTGTFVLCSCNKFDIFKKNRKKILTIKETNNNFFIHKMSVNLLYKATKSFFKVENQAKTAVEKISLIWYTSK